MDKERKVQLVREVKDTLGQFVMLARSGLPLKCRFCCQPVHLHEGGTIINKGSPEDGIYHIWCHQEAFPEKYGLKR